MRLRSPLLALALAALFIITSFGSACSPPKRDQLVKIAGYGQQIGALIDANRTLPDDLLSQKLISQAAHDQLAGHFARAKQLTETFNSGMTALLASEQPSTGQLVSTVAQMIDEAQSIRGLIPSAAAQRVVSGLEIALRAVANYFALHVQQARATGLTDKQIASRLGLSDKDGAAVIQRIETYTGE